MKPVVKFSALILVISGLSGLAYWDDMQTEKDKVQSEENSRVFVSLKSEDVTSLDLAIKESNLKITLQKENGTWWITAPEKYKADDKIISGMLTQVVNFKFEKSLDKGSKDRLSEFGLVDPDLKLEINGGTLSVLVGNQAPVGFNRYILSGNSEGVMLAGGYVFTTLNKKLYEFKDKTIQMPPQAQLTNLSLINSEEIAFKRGSDAWTIASGSSQAIDEDGFSDFIGYWRKNVISDFFEEGSPLSEAIRLNNPGTELVATLRWETSDKVETTWQFLDNNKVLYGRKVGTNLLVKISDEAKEQLEKSLWDFQFKKIVEIDSNEVKEITLNEDKYSKVEGAWKSESGEEKEFVRSLLIDLEYANATELKNRTEIVLNPEKLKYTLLLKLENSAQISMKIYESEKDPAILYIDKDGAESIFVSPTSLIENFTDKHIAKNDDEHSQG